jgi:branched-chain amino acid transport system substrate-binding protein
VAFAKSRARTALSQTAAIGIVVILLIVAVAGVYYYYTTTGPSTSGPSAINIGMTMPLTGSLAQDGKMSLDGLKLWAANVNASGGIYVSSLGKKLPVHLIYYDDGSSSATVTTDYQQLVTQNVSFLIAPYSSGLTLAAAPIAEQHHILLLSHGGASDSIWAKGYKYVVGVLSPGSHYLIPVLQMLQNQNSSTPIKVALFYGNDAFSISAIQGASAYINSTTGFQVVYNKAYDESASSYTAELTAIQSSGAQVVIGGAHFADGETIMKNIQSLGMHFNMVSLLVAPDDPSFLSDLGATANNVVAPSQWEANLDFSHFTPYFGDISGSQFASSFNTRFGFAPNYEAAEAYNTGLVLQKGITDSGSLNSTTVRNQLSSENFWTFYGNFQIGSTGIQTGHTMVVIQWQNGIKQVVWPKAVATATFVYPAP